MAREPRLGVEVSISGPSGESRKGGLEEVNVGSETTHLINFCTLWLHVFSRFVTPFFFLLLMKCYELLQRISF